MVTSESMLSLHVNEFVEKPQVENASEFKFEIALSSMASVFLFVFFYIIGSERRTLFSLIERPNLKSIFATGIISVQLIVIKSNSLQQTFIFTSICLQHRLD